MASNMSKLFSLLKWSLLLHVALSKPVNHRDHSLQRITNGQICDIELFPFAVQYFKILEDDRTILCGGSLLTYQWVLSAAHCHHIPHTCRMTIVVAGTSHHHFRVYDSGGIVRKVIKEMPHPDFNKDAQTIMTNDILVSKLESPLPSNNPRIKLVNLPDPDFTSKAKRAVVMGWGKREVVPLHPWLIKEFPEYFHNLEPVAKPIQEDVLTCVEIPVAEQDECQRNNPKRFKIWPTHLCGKPYHGKDACFGDSGGPLAVNQTIIGVVSQGFGCGQNAFAFYGRVDKYYGFLRKHIETLYIPDAGALRKRKKKPADDTSSSAVADVMLEQWLMLITVISSLILLLQ